MYYPVSALVTLFANILQNPQDVQARSDLRLMEAVVKFLNSVMNIDQENMNDDDGSVKRMLAVCDEILRIGKVVLNKAENESAGKRKRKTEEQVGPARNGNKAMKPSDVPTASRQEQNAQRQPVSTAGPPGDGMSVDPQVGAHSLSHGKHSSSGYQALYTNDLGSPFSGDSMNWLNDFDVSKSSSASPPITMENFQNMPMLSANSFEQPFVPQDLWQMPMTFEWDWADVSNNMQWDSQTQNNNNNLHL
jgi:hypothetical protein